MYVPTRAQRKHRTEGSGRRVGLLTPYVGATSGFVLKLCKDAEEDLRTETDIYYTYDRALGLFVGVHLRST